jgi:hypothetical protein
MRQALLVALALFACKKPEPPAGTFDLDAGGPLVEARAIRAIQKEPVLAIHNTNKRNALPLFHWDYDFKRWGWGTATLTHRSHSGPEVWRFELGDPLQRPCDAGFLADRLIPVAGSSNTWVLEGGPLAGELVRRTPAAGCHFEIASRKWAEAAGGWSLP